MLGNGGGLIESPAVFAELYSLNGCGQNYRSADSPHEIDSCSPPPLPPIAIAIITHAFKMSEVNSVECKVENSAKKKKEKRSILKKANEMNFSLSFSSTNGFLSLSLPFLFLSPHPPPPRPPPLALMWNVNTETFMLLLTVFDLIAFAADSVLRCWFVVFFLLILPAHH